MTVSATGEGLDEIASAFELGFGADRCSKQDEQQRDGDKYLSHWFLLRKCRFCRQRGEAEPRGVAALGAGMRARCQPDLSAVAVAIPGRTRHPSAIGCAHLPC